MSYLANKLLEMGFSRENVELAIQNSGSNNLEATMDWLISHTDEFNNPDSQSQIAAKEQENSSDKNEPNKSEVKSIKCDDCGKLFTSQEEAEFHASKIGHRHFSESTEEKLAPTEEEKREQMDIILNKLKQRRLQREAKEKEEDLQREKMRIKSGKELFEAKKRYEENEMKKFMEQKKRDKEDERLARQRVREQIEQDKLARKEKIEAVQQAQPILPAKSSLPKSSSEVKLQIRLPNGSTLSETFGAKEPLCAVRLFIEMNRSDDQGPFNLMTNFPKKIFSSEDYEKSLETLGLVPTATLFVSKA